MGPSGAASNCVAIAIADFGILGREMSEESTTPDLVKLSRRLREAGREFIKAHDRTAVVIQEAAEAGMSPDAISQASELSSETVSAFLRAGRD